MTTPANATITKNLCVRISQALDDKLALAALKLRTSKQDLVQQAIEKLLEEIYS